MIIYKCLVEIEKSVPRIIVWYHKARQEMQDNDQMDRYGYPYLSVQDYFWL